MSPRPELAAETRAHEFRDDANIFFRQTKHLREHTAHVEDRLRFLVERQCRTVPDRGCALELDGIVGLGRSDVSLIELDRRARESDVGIAALALQALLRTVAGGNCFWIIFGF